MPIGYDSDASTSTRLGAGYYLARRLQRIGEGVRAENVLEGVEHLKAMARAAEDTTEAVEMAYADRDAADDDLDAIATTVGRFIVGDDHQARKQPPYTLVFPGGIEETTEAPISQNERAYRLFGQRVEEHLPEDHPARQAVAKALPKALAEFTSEAAALDLAIGKRAAAEARLEGAELEFDQQLDKLFHSLAEQYGALTLTVPDNASVAIPIGTQITVVAANTGKVTVAAASGVTVLTNETYKLRKQGSAVTLTKVDANAWDLAGDVELA